MTSPQSNDLLDALSEIRTWSQGDQRAPHKPLLLLLALGALQRGERWLPYEQVEEDLTPLLDEFGPTRSAQKPYEPFWRLRTDGVWEVPEAAEIEPHVNAAGSPKVSVLRESEARGGFTQEAYDELRASPQLLVEAGQLLLERSFESSLWDDILAAVGLSLALDKKRDPKFRLRVLNTYNRQCVVCGFDGRLGGASIALEAAHIRWHAYGGPDETSNGLAMCSIHHRAFDRGAIGLEDDGRLLVSEALAGGELVEALVFQYRDRPVRRPWREEDAPRPEHVRWHRREVFQAPAV